MKKEYDFSKGVRGKFYRPNAKLNIPIYLDEENKKFISDLAKKRGLDQNILVNEILKTDIKLFDIVK